MLRTMPHPLVLSTPQMVRAILDLEGIELDARTVSDWARGGIAPASISPRQSYREGKRGSVGRLYSLADFHRIRLIARLKREGVSSQKIRNILAFCERELPDVLKPGTRAVLIVDHWRAVIVHQPGRDDVEVPSGQIRLPLREVVTDAKTAARYAAA